MPEEVKMIDINELLDLTVEMDASDLHLVVGDPPTMRHQGRLKRIEGYPVLAPEHTEYMMKQIATHRSVRELEDQLGADFGFSFGDKARFRVSLFMQKHSVALNLRLIPYRILTFEQLGLSQHVQQLLHLPRGLILITGPTGSGKTTTLATMVNYINEHRDCHIITIEDPIEYYHNHKMSVVSQREVGVDVPTFDIGIVKALRQDPDVILVGEMRDLATISAAVRAAETGHLVFSTLHTTGAARTVDRIVDVFPFDQQEQIRTQLSGNLVAVISQILIPKIGGGRVASYEIMICTPAIRYMIRERKTHSITSAIQTGVQLGMQTMDAHLFDLYTRHMIEREEMIRLAQRPDEILEKMGEQVPEHMRVPEPSQQPQRGPAQYPQYAGQQQQQQERPGIPPAGPQTGRR